MSETKVAENEGRRVADVGPSRHGGDIKLTW